MLEPFSTLQESGLAQPQAGADKLDGWSPELLVGLRERLAAALDELKSLA